MKKHIFAITILSLFFCTQTNPMNASSSAQDIKDFQKSLMSKLMAERVSFLDNEQMPQFYNGGLLQWKQHIRDMTQKYNINRATAGNILVNTLKEIIEQEIAFRNSNFDREIIENLYEQKYRSDVSRAVYYIFGY